MSFSIKTTKMYKQKNGFLYFGAEELYKGKKREEELEM